MPRLSPKASELVRELWPRFSSNSEAIAWSHRKESRTTAWCLRLLRQLTGTGEPNAAPYVLGAYLQHDLPVATIAEMLDVLESRATAESLIGRERERAESDAWWDRDWPEVWEKLEPFRQQTGGWAAFATASLSRNGYIRERAVQALSQAVIDGREVLFLVLRTSDHVPQVRQAAASAMRSRIAAPSGAALVRSLPLVMHLRQYRGRGEPTVTDSILQFLSSPDGWPVLSAGLEATDARVRRESFTLAFSTEHRSEVVYRALRSSDPLVQLWGLRQSASQPVPVDDLLAAARYPFTPVRAAALERLSEVDPAVAATEWKRALLDSSPSIRAAARRRLLAETTSFDLRAFYRDALAGTEPTSVAPAVAGLADVGRAEDAAELILLTEHPRAKVREAVAAALARLLGAEAIDADADRQKPPSRAKGGASSSASPDAAAGPKNLGYRSERGAGKSSRVAAPPSATSPMGSAGLLTTSDLPSRSAPHRGPDSGSTLARQVSQERCPARTWQSRCRATAEHARSCTC